MPMVANVRCGRLQSKSSCQSCCNSERAQEQATLTSWSVLYAARKPNGRAAASVCSLGHDAARHERHPQIRAGPEASARQAAFQRHLYCNIIQVCSTFDICPLRADIGLSDLVDQVPTSSLLPSCGPALYMCLLVTCTPSCLHCITLWSLRLLVKPR